MHDYVCGCINMWVCTGPTLPGLTAIHSEVGGLLGLEPRLLHARAIHLHSLWVAAFTHIHLQGGAGVKALPHCHPSLGGSSRHLF